MKNNLRKINEAFDGKLVGTKHMKAAVCETLLLFPENIVHTVTRTCWFISSFDDAWAFTFTGNDLKDQHLIFLSDDLLQQKIQQIRRSIAHEIGHVILKHRNSIIKRQTKREITRQEKEADEFVKKYFSKRDAT